MSAGPSEPVDFPVLTEVLGADVPGTEVPAAAPPAEAGWVQLAMQLEQQLSERLIERCHVLLDEQIADTLTPLLARAAEQIAQDLRTAVPLMVRDLVVTAVAEELDRRHAGTTNDRP